MLQSIYTPDHYTADGVLTTFAFTFRILQKSDLVFTTYNPATGVVAVLELNSDYTIADGDVNTDNGGHVVCTPVLASGLEIFLSRHTQRTQLTHIEEGSAFSAALMMTALDRLTMFVHELAYQVRKSIKLPDTSTLVDIDASRPVAGELLRWNGDADGLENISLVTLAASTVIIPVSVDEGESEITITHNLGSVSARLIGVTATWHSTFKLISQSTNAIVVEASSECPAGGGTVIATVGVPT